MNSDAEQLLDRWKNGDQQAATELFNRYVKQLTQVARNRLAARFVGIFDPEDVVMSVMRSALVGIRDEKYTFQDSGKLWSFLVTMTIFKTREKVRLHSAAKRDASLQVNDSAALMSILAHDPSDEAVVAFQELIASIHAELADDDLSRILDLRLDGARQTDIARELGLTPRTIRRKNEIIDSIVFEVIQKQDPELFR